MTPRILLASLFAFLLQVSPTLAAFETFTDEPGNMLLATDLRPITGRWRATFSRIDRYGLPELSTNSLSIGSGQPWKWLGRPWFIDLNAASTGDELYSEYKSDIRIRVAVRQLPFCHVGVRGGVQTLQVKGYGTRSQAVVGANAGVNLTWDLSLEGRVDGVALPGGTLPVSMASPQGSIGLDYSPGKLWMSLRFQLRPQWEPQIFLLSDLEVNKRIRLKVLWRERPDMFGGGIGYSFDRFSLSVAYTYQPIIGSTRSLAMAVSW